MRLSETACRARFGATRSARLATVRPDGAPHLVPVTFAVIDDPGDTVAFAVDHKPKSTAALQRLANIAAEPRVCLLADHYDDDWSQLWWVRADAVARLLAGTEADTALDALARKYAQYRGARPGGPVVACTVTRWTGWSGAPQVAVHPGSIPPPTPMV